MKSNEAAQLFEARFLAALSPKATNADFDCRRSLWEV
jgi:hypothetical protein